MANEFRGTLWRALNPEFGRAPLSPIGSMLSGGRFNPVGVPAIYLASDPFTALLEISPTSTIKHEALLLVPVESTLAHFVDLTNDAELNECEITTDDLASSWSKELGKPTPVQQLYYKLHPQGFSGVKFRSRANPYLFNFCMWDLTETFFEAATNNWKYRISGASGVSYRSITEQLDARSGEAAYQIDQTLIEALSWLTKLQNADPGQADDVRDMIFRAAKGTRQGNKLMPENEDFIALQDWLATRIRSVLK
jgi:RES domain-containing protein